MMWLSAWKGSSVSQQFHLSEQFTVAPWFTSHRWQGSPGGTSSLQGPRRNTTRFWQSSPVAVDEVSPSKTSRMSLHAPAALQVAKLCSTEVKTCPAGEEVHTVVAPFAL